MWVNMVIIGFLMFLPGIQRPTPWSFTQQVSPAVEQVEATQAQSLPVTDPGSRSH